MTQTQVDAKAHYLRRYLTLPRSVTHWHQAAEVAESIQPGGSVLEIGVGCSHTTWMLRHWGYQVTTLDFDPELAPDIVADVRHIPAGDASFDCVLAAEVLEHLPFDDFETALVELKRVSKGRVIITLPAPFVGLSALVNLPRLRPWGVHLGGPWRVRHRWDGQHHWELGKRGHGLAEVRRRIQRAGLSIEREFRPAPSLYCYFFVMSARADAAPDRGR